MSIFRQLKCRNALERCFSHASPNGEKSCHKIDTFKISIYILVNWQRSRGILMRIACCPCQKENKFYQRINTCEYISLLRRKKIRQCPNDGHADPPLRKCPVSKSYYEWCGMF